MFTCNHKLILSVASIQGGLNILISLLGGTCLAESDWSLQLQLTLKALVSEESMNVLKTRGYHFLNFDLFRRQLANAGCNFYKLYSAYDFSLFTLIGWHVWIAVGITC